MVSRLRSLLRRHEAECYHSDASISPRQEIHSLHPAQQWHPMQLVPHPMASIDQHANKADLGSDR
jgi:hypothetical protein